MQLALSIWNKWPFATRVEASCVMRRAMRQWIQAGMSCHRKGLRLPAHRILKARRPCQKPGQDLDLSMHQTQYEVVVNQNQQSECEIERYATRFEYMQYKVICHRNEGKMCDETCNAAIDSSWYVLPLKRFEVSCRWDSNRNTSMSEAWSRPWLNHAQNSIWSCHKQKPRKWMRQAMVIINDSRHDATMMFGRCAKRNAMPKWISIYMCARWKGSSRRIHWGRLAMCKEQDGGNSSKQ